MALSEGRLYACYERLERPLFNVLYRLLWSREECQDALQDAFLRVWQRRESVDESRIDALVWTAALNLARNRLRWKRLWHMEAFDADWPASEATPEQVVDSLTQQRRLHSALRQLPAGMREVLLLGEFAELRQAEIAAVLRIPVGTVASRRHQALGRLRKLLADKRHG